MRENEKSEQVIRSACGQLLALSVKGWNLQPEQKVGKRGWRQSDNMGVRFEGWSFSHAEPDDGGGVVTTEVLIMERGSIHLFVYPGQRRPMHAGDDFRSGYMVERRGGRWMFSDVRLESQKEESEGGWGLMAGEVEDLMVGLREVVGN